MSRRHDEQVERIVNGFEDQFFWPEILKDQLSCMTRYTDVQHQFAGIDFTLGPMNFDSKAKCHDCLNERLNYIGFELSFVNKAGNVQDGWLIDPKKKTDWYEIVEISATVDDYHQLQSMHQITAANSLWICRKDLDTIIDEIDQHTVIHPFRNLLHYVRTTGDHGGADALGNSILDDDGKYRVRPCPKGRPHLTYNPQLEEKSLNLVVPRNVLHELPQTREFHITRRGVSKAR